MCRSVSRSDGSYTGWDIPFKSLVPVSRPETSNMSIQKVLKTQCRRPGSQAAGLFHGILILPVHIRLSTLQNVQLWSHLLMYAAIIFLHSVICFLTYDEFFFNHKEVPNFWNLLIYYSSWDILALAGNMDQILFFPQHFITIQYSVKLLISGGFCPLPHMEDG